MDLTEEGDNDGHLGWLSPVAVRGQRVAKARRILGLNEEQHCRGDKADQRAAEDLRTTDVSNVLQILHHLDEFVVRKAFQRLLVKWYHCETERLQSLLRAAGVFPRACNLAPHVVQACQVCRPWKRPGHSDKFTSPLAMPFNEEARFDLLFARTALGPGLG